MKTSNKMLWGSLVGFFGITVIFLVALRILLGGNSEPAGGTVPDAAYGSREIAMADFAGVDLQGHWQAEVVQGPQEHIAVEGPEDLLAALSVRRRGESLALEMADQRHDARKLHVAITMPVLHALRTKGVVNLTLSGFETDRLSMRFEGVTSVRGQEGRIGDLRFRGQGVSRVDLRDVPVRTADLDCEGVIKIDLTMAGGELTGSIKGVGELRYAGETSRESIQREGPCKVTRETRT